MVNSIAKDGFRKVLLNRGNKSVPDYSVPSDILLSVDENTPNVASQSVVKVIPISDGTSLDNGNNTLTGSSGGDNSTDNTSVFKQGAGETDDTAQNLIATNTSTSKVWSVSLSTFGDDTQYTGCWIYVKDSTALDKIVSVEIKLGSDSSNYYSQTYLNADLDTLWNWLTSEDVLGSWTETGTVSGDIDYFEIEIITNNSTDEFVAGDVVYDLLRQWSVSDTLKGLYTSVSLSETLLQSSHTFLLTVGEANGFFITKLLVQNSDSTPIVCFESLNNGDSKSNTDQWKVVFKNNLN